MQNSFDNSKALYKVRSGITYELDTACGKLYITCNNFKVTQTDNDTVLLKEVFIRLGKAGGCAMALTESLGKMISQFLKLGGDPNDILKQLAGVSCHQAGSKPSCVSAVAEIIREHIGGNNAQS